jgi:hypothetical protein
MYLQHDAMKTEQMTECLLAKMGIKIKHQQKSRCNNESQSRRNRDQNEGLSRKVRGNSWKNRGH